MKKLLLAVAAVFGLAASAQADEMPDLVTMLSSGEPQTQLMTMVLTMQAVQKGVNTHVLLCGPAGDLALKGLVRRKCG